jgi:hypothetical protein
MKLNDKVYDVMKWCVLVFIPAATSLYVGLSMVWHWPLAEEVAKTSALVCAFLGALLGISNLSYRLGGENENITKGN